MSIGPGAVIWVVSRHRRGLWFAFGPARDWIGDRLAFPTAQRAAGAPVGSLPGLPVRAGRMGKGMGIRDPEQGTMSAGTENLDSLTMGVAERARAAGVFGAVACRAGLVECCAMGPASPAWYRLSAEGGRLWVSLVMGDRWLSESIETDLLHTGDKLDELLEEELIELGYCGARVPFEHFRSEDKLFTFRSPVDAMGFGRDDAGSPGLVSGAGTLLLAYEACFRNLGDMSAGTGT